MAEPIFVELTRADDVEDLLDVLGRHGITGALLTRGGLAQIEIRYEHENTERLLAEVAAAVEAWLRDHDATDARVRVAGDTLALTPHGDLSEGLAARAKERAREAETAGHPSGERQSSS